MILSILVFSCVFARLVVVDVLVRHSSASAVFLISSLLTDSHYSSRFVSHGGPCLQSCSFRMNVLASISLVMESEGLMAVGQYLHVLCEVKFLINCTRYLTNCRCGCLVEDICSQFFSSIASDPNHKLSRLYPPVNNSKYMLRRQRNFFLPRFKTDRHMNSFIPAMCAMYSLDECFTF